MFFMSQALVFHGIACCVALLYGLNTERLFKNTKPVRSVATVGRRPTANSRQNNIVGQRLTMARDFNFLARFFVVLIQVVYK